MRKLVARCPLEALVRCPFSDTQYDGEGCAARTERVDRGGDMAWARPATKSMQATTSTGGLLQCAGVGRRLGQSLVPVQPKGGRQAEIAATGARVAEQLTVPPETRSQRA